MEVDTASSVTQVPVKHSLPEIEIYCYLLVLIFLIDKKKYNEVEHLRFLLFNFFIYGRTMLSMSHCDVLRQKLVRQQALHG